MAESVDREWPVRWAANRRAQLREVASLPVEQRVELLEQMLEDADRSGALTRACARREAEHLRVWRGA